LPHAIRRPRGRARLWPRGLDAPEVGMEAEWPPAGGFPGAVEPAAGGLPLRTVRWTHQSGNSKAARRGRGEGAVAPPDAIVEHVLDMAGDHREALQRALLEPVPP